MRKVLQLTLATLLIIGTTFALDITMDAERDAFYNTMSGPADGYIYLGLEAQGINQGGVDDEDDLSAYAWFAWDENYFYSYLEITDEYITVNNATQWENDATELKIEPDPFSCTETTAGIAGFRLSALSEADAEVPEGVHNVNSGEAGAWDTFEGEDYARKETDKGYNLEFRIPFEVITKDDRFVDNTVGGIMGMAVNVMDSDESVRDHVLRWASNMDDQVWNHPWRHGTVTFLEGNKVNLSTENAITGVDTNTVNYNPPGGGGGGGEFAITIDAQRDAWYNTLNGPADGWIYLSPEAEGTTGLQPDDEFDCSALIWQSWDDTYYYFYAEVQDEYVTVNNSTVYENDAIEQKIDPDPNMIDETTTGVAATRMSALSADDAEVPEAVQNVDSGEMTGGWVPTEDDYARTETDLGYNLEWRIPWDAIQQGDRAVNVGAGEIFGLAINVMDNDESARDHVLRWASDMGDLVWNEPKRHGTVTFKENHILSLSTENAITGVDTNTIDFSIPPSVAVDTNPVQAPVEFELAQNYPNPFNPTTTIAYALPQTGNVMLRVFDLNGREVATLVNNEVQQAGVHTVMFDASDLSSGVYFYQIQTPTQTFARKMTLVR